MKNNYVSGRKDKFGFGLQKSTARVYTSISWRGSQRKNLVKSFRQRMILRMLRRGWDTGDIKERTSH